MQDSVAEIKRIVAFIKDEADKRNSKHLVVGVSGGLDSTVVAGLCKLAITSTKLYHATLTEGQKQTHVHPAILALQDWYGSKVTIVSLNGAFNNIMEPIHPRYDASKKISANLRQRLLMSALYTYAEDANALVVGATNRAEYELGLFIRAFDGDIKPISHLYRHELRDIGRQLNIPDNILFSKAAYEKAEMQLAGKSKPTEHVWRQKEGSEWKRQPTPALEVA